MKQNDKPLSTTEAARALGISVKTLRKLIKSGDLKAFRPGKRSFKIMPDAIEDYKRRKERELRRELDDEKDVIDDPVKAS